MLREQCSIISLFSLCLFLQSLYDHKGRLNHLLTLFTRVTDCAVSHGRCPTAGRVRTPLLINGLQLAQWPACRLLTHIGTKLNFIVVRCIPFFKSGHVTRQFP